MPQLFPDLSFGCGAIFDADRVYRYRLFREWQRGDGCCCFIMLNPSTADEAALDPTVRRCLDYAQRWGYRGLEVVNLFALRSTDPKQLPKHAEPIGSENDYWIRRIVGDAQLLVAAWGSHAFMKKPLARRALAVREIVADADKRLLCLGTNADGQPVHPLYQPKEAQLIELP